MNCPELTLPAPDLGAFLQRHRRRSCYSEEGCHYPRTATQQSGNARRHWSFRRKKSGFFAARFYRNLGLGAASVGSFFGCTWTALLV